MTTSSAKLASSFTTLDRADAIIAGHTFNNGFAMQLKRHRSTQKMDSASTPTQAFRMLVPLILDMHQDLSGGEFGIWLKERA